MSGSQQPKPVYRFDQFRLDLGRGTLRGPGGTDISLRPRAFTLLCHLLDHPGQLHSREDLFEALWPGVVVTDDSLTQCVSDLRQALGSRAKHVLRTIPRRGYILSVDVHIDRADPPPAPVPLPATTHSVSDYVSKQNEPLVVEPISAPPEHAELLGRFWDETLVQLASFRYLRVQRATGTGVSEGYRVRCNASVVDGYLHASVLLEEAATGMVVWTEQIDEPALDGLALTERVILPLAHRLVRQTLSEGRRRTRQKPLATLTARELCLLAIDNHMRGTEIDTLSVLALMEQAIALDPDHAAAYAWKAYAVQRGFTYGWGRLKGVAARDRALTLARKGVVLAPDSPLCLSVLAWCLYLSEHWDEAVATARLALNGAWTAGIDERVACCQVLLQTGHADEAVDSMRRTVSFERYPMPIVYAVFGRALLMANRPQEALPHLRICAARLPDYPGCHHSILMAAHECGYADEARRAYDDIQRLQPGWHPSANVGPWIFRHAEDAERLHAAFRAAEAGVSRAQRLETTGEVLSFRLRDGTGRT